MKNEKIKLTVLNAGAGFLAVSGAGFSVLGPGAGTARAHGVVGDRFFPPTIATDDPFATDELLLPSYSYFKNAGTPETGTSDFGFEFDKEIFPQFALGISGDFLYLQPNGEPSTSGFD